MENYGDEILWDVGPTPSRGKNETLWFSFFSTIISATFLLLLPSHPRLVKLFFGCGEASFYHGI